MTCETLSDRQKQIKDGLLDLMGADFFVRCHGEVFSSGLSALQKGNLYIVGLNPGAGNRYPTIRNHVEDWNLADFSAFTDQCWSTECWSVDCYAKQSSLKCNRRDCQRGKDKIQAQHRRVVVRTLEVLGQSESDLSSVFATNAIFARSMKGDTFRRDVGYSLAAAWQYCSTVHRYLLNIVQPTVIVCFGYGKSNTSYSMMKSLCTNLSDQYSYSQDGWKIDNFRWVTGKCHLTDWIGEVLIVGVRHPSYGSTAVEVPRYAELIQGT